MHQSVHFSSFTVPFFCYILRYFCLPDALHLVSSPCSNLHLLIVIHNSFVYCSPSFFTLSHVFLYQWLFSWLSFSFRIPFHNQYSVEMYINILFFSNLSWCSCGTINANHYSLGPLTMLAPLAKC